MTAKIVYSQGESNYRLDFEGNEKSFHRFLREIKKLPDVTIQLINTYD